jgi:tetratricopeptide (TPR) repeat protein
VEQNAELAERWLNSGLQKYDQGDMLGTIQDWEKAIEFKPDYHEAWYNRGLSLDDLGRKEEAIASYDKAIEFKLDNHEAWSDRGYSLNELGRYEEAIVSCEKAIEFKFDYPEAWINRGNSLYALDRKEEAIVSYEKAIEFKPDYHEAWFGRASCICSTSQNTLLKSDIAAFIRRQNIFALSQAQPHLFALKEALPHFQKGTIGSGKIHQALGDAQVNHAGLQTQKEDWREAIRCYKVALSCLPIESHALDHLEVIQAIVRTLLRLNAIPAARHYQTQGSHLYEALRTQAQDKRTFEAKFSTFRLAEIDLLVGENEPRLALTQAEFYKNRALTWLLDKSQETTQSPTYDQMQSHLTPGNAIVYWHQSTDRITTFILTNDNAEPIVLDCNRQQQYKRFIVWKDKWDKDYEDYRSKKSATQLNHPWQQQMSDRLKQLAGILEIDAIERHLKNAETLILFPHRDLHRYPIHALFDRPTTRSLIPPPRSSPHALRPNRKRHHPTTHRSQRHPHQSHQCHPQHHHSTTHTAKPSLFSLHRTCRTRLPKTRKLRPRSLRSPPNRQNNRQPQPAPPAPRHPFLLRNLDRLQHQPHRISRTHQCLPLRRNPNHSQHPLASRRNRQRLVHDSLPPTHQNRTIPRDRPPSHPNLDANRHLARIHPLARGASPTPRTAEFPDRSTRISH